MSRGMVCPGRELGLFIVDLAFAYDAVFMSKYNQFS